MSCCVSVPKEEVCVHDCWGRLRIGGGSGRHDANTAAYASAPLTKASLRLQRLRDRFSHGDAKPEPLKN
jgi:hypothetical protein